MAKCPSCANELVSATPEEGLMNPYCNNPECPVTEVIVDEDGNVTADITEDDYDNLPYDELSEEEDEEEEEEL